MASAADIAGAMISGIFSSLILRWIRHTTQDLQSHFYALSHENIGVTATIYSGDELGQLASSCNKISPTTNEANRKAQKQEEAKENLQNQLIRLSDDVEVVARGDLTV